jgi:hypothetical protein
LLKIIQQFPLVVEIAAVEVAKKTALSTQRIVAVHVIFG